MKYQIVTEDCRADLEKAVAKLLSDGWQPHGGLAVSTYSYMDRNEQQQTGEIWAQAMIHVPIDRRLRG